MDQIVESILMGIFERAKKINEKEFVEQQVQCTAVQYQQALKQARTDYTKYAKEISKWEGLMLDSIEGTCVFTPEQIKNRMDSVQQSMDVLTEEIEKLQLKATEAEETVAEIMEQHQRLLSWAEMFATASPEEKKMVASYVMKAVTLTRDYGIQIEFNISEAQYLGGMDMG